MRMKNAVKIILPVIVLTFMGARGMVRGYDDMETTAATGTSTAKVCLPPAWSQKLPTSKRFETVLDGYTLWDGTVLDGLTVLDWETGLVWETSPSSNLYSWDNANYAGKQVDYGYRKGWRLPTVEELASLIDPSVSGSPKLPSGHPFIDVQGAYWSSTTYAGGTGTAYYVNFNDGSVRYGDKRLGAFVWLVRGGNAYDGK